MSNHINEEGICMVSRHLKKLSPSVIIREIEMKTARYHLTTVRYHLLPVMTVYVKKSESSMCFCECN